jgi:ubiquinone biosynthesis monooxygenase Coq7
MRHYSFIDNLLTEVDSALRSVFVPTQRSTNRVNPSHAHAACDLNEEERRHVAGLVRVNHAGEVCAQALYQGQALTAQLDRVKKQMSLAAEEELDHLAWCEERLNELNSHVSVLNPLWYMSSFLLGAMAGWAGDAWSLGFVAETERQVSAHLQRHQQKLPSDDKKTQAMLNQMQVDESQHAEMAQSAGANELPYVIKQLMACASKCLTRSSYYI